MKLLRLLCAVFALSCAYAAFGQVVQPIVQPHVSFVDSNGLPCSGCSLYTYSAGTTTALATYQDASGTVANTNPVVLDVTGSATVWVLPGSAYKFVVKNALGNTVWSADNVTPPSFCPTGCKINGAISFGALPTAHLTFTNLNPMLAPWTFDYTTPQSAMDSLSNGGATSASFSTITIGGSTLTNVGTSPLPWIFDSTSQQSVMNSISNSATTNAFFGTQGSKISPTRSVQAWGALCDEVTDDSAAILAAIASCTADASTGACALSFPSSGKCRVTQPIIFTTDNLVQILGTGTRSGLLCDYATWAGTDYTCLELQGMSGHYSLGETFSNFVLNAVNNSSVVSTGFKIYHSLDHSTGVFKIVGLNVDNVRASGFDTGFDISDVTESNFRHDTVEFSRLGFKIVGQNVNDTFDGLIYDTATNANTSSTDPTQGIIIDGKIYPDTVFYAPEGINLTRSNILTAATSLTLGNVLEINVDHNIFDLNTATAVTIGQSDGVPRNLRFTDNWLFTNAVNGTLLSLTTPNTTRGITIADNYVEGVAGNNQTGISIGSGPAWINVHLDRNRVENTAVPITINASLSDSTIKNNWGNTNTGPFLTIPTTGSCGVGMFIDGNSSADSFDIADVTCTGSFMGLNYSPVQTTGPYLTSGSGNFVTIDGNGNGSNSGIATTAMVVKTGTPADGTCAQWAGGLLGSTGSACGGGGGAMVYPAAGGIAVYNGAGAWGTSLTAPSGTIVGTTDTQTLTNKTIDGVSPATMAFVNPTSSIQTQLNAKQATITLTTTGTSGAATLSAGTLNIPQYATSSIANVQITTGTTAIPANSCTTNTATTMSGLVTTSALVPPTPTASTNTITGWGSSGGLSFAYFPTANTFNWSICNSTSSSITPSASITWNVGAR